MEQTSEGDVERRALRKWYPVVGGVAMTALFAVSFVTTDTWLGRVGLIFALLVVLTCYALDAYLYW